MSSYISVVESLDTSLHQRSVYCAAVRGKKLHLTCYLNQLPLRGKLHLVAHGCHQKHTLKDRRPSTAACQACWAIGTKEFKQCTVGKNILYWADQSSHSRTKIYCTGTTCQINPARKDPCHFYSLSPHSSQFQQSAGAIRLVSLGVTPPWIY